MINLKSIKLRNIVTYRQAEFSFTKGLHVVRGENRSGKSLLFSSIPNILYNAPPLSNKKNNTKTLVGAGKIVLSTMTNGDKYLLKQFGNKTSVGYEVYKNGENLEARTQQFARDVIEEAFPMNVDQFYSFTYLNSIRGNKLLFATGSERYKFFESVFDLHIYDAIKEKLSDRYSTVKSKAIELQLANKRLAEINLDKKQVKSVETIYTDLKVRVEKLQKKQDIYNTEIQSLTSYVAIAGQIQNDLEIKQLEKLLKEFEDKKSILEKDYESAIKAKQQNKLYNQYKEQRKDLESKLIKTRSTNDIKNEYLLKKKSFDTLKEQHTKLKNDSAILIGIIKEIGEKKTEKLFHRNSKKLTKELEQFRSELYIKKAAYKIVTDSHSNNCPVCDNKVTKKDVSKFIQVEIETLEKTVEELSTTIEYTKDIKGVDKNAIVLFKDVDRKFSKLKETMESLQKEFKIAKRQRIYKKELDNLPSIKKIDINVDTDNLSVKIDKIEDKISAIKNDIKLHEKLDSLGLNTNVKAAKERLNVLNELVSKRGKNLKKYHAKLMELAGQRSSLKYAYNELMQLEQRIEKLEQYGEQSEIYETLLKVYSSRGLRQGHIENFAQLFKTSLNNYSSLLFNESTKFSINVNKNNFDILAERNNKITDISTFSGSESRCFQSLCAISLLSFVPDNQRSNIIVLDEMESNLSVASKKLFVSEFLPNLKNIVPCVIVVTPLSQEEMFIDECLNYNVVKKKGISNIKFVN